MSDIEIAQKATMKPVLEIGASLGIGAEHLEPYGHYKAKISLKYLDSLPKKSDSKLVLVTAISPTPAGEGKTTTTVGLGDALRHIGKNALIGSSLWNEGWSSRRRIRTSCSDGRYQSSLHRRFQCNRAGK